MNVLRTHFVAKFSIGVLGCLLWTHAAVGQNSGSTPTSSVIANLGQPTLFLTFRQQEMALGQEEQTMAAQGATPEQIGAWEDQNLALFQAQAQRAQELSAYSAAQPMDFIADLDFPSDDPPQVEALMTALTTVLNDFSQIYNQILQGLPEILTLQDVSDLNNNTENNFQQQDAGKLQALSGQVDAVHMLTAHSPLDLPPPLAVPASASPSLRNYLVACDQIERAEIQLHNQYCAGDLGRLQAAQDQWKQQNGALFMHLEQLASQLSSPTNN